MAHAAKPVIGITKPEIGDNLAYFAIRTAIRLAGGAPLKLTTGMSWRDAQLSGLVIGGGADVFPAHYGQEAIEGASYDEGRDEMEMYWARTARDTSLPTLAICRGAQVMNVANGGTLHQDLEAVHGPLEHPKTPVGQALFRKPINISTGSLLHRITGEAHLEVNSLHRQGISGVGDGLIVTATEPNGIIQAIEDRERHFYLGVQFHPEFLIHRRVFRAIFEELVSSAAEFATRQRSEEAPV